MAPMPTEEIIFAKKEHMFFYYTTVFLFVKCFFKNTHLLQQLCRRRIEFCADVCYTDGV